jgi:hypothetical protein
MITITASRIGRFLQAAAALALVGTLAGTAAGAPPAGIASAQTRTDRATQVLFDAVHSNDFAAAEAAVAAGADVEARDRWDISAIELAIDKGYFRIAHFLVSVRNSREPAVADETRAQPASAAAKVPAQTTGPDQRVSKTAKSAKSAKAAALPEQVVAQPQWPADKPNPFDPSAPAFGTSLPLIVPPQAAQAPAAAEGPLLATDDAIRRGSEGLR